MYHGKEWPMKLVDKITRLPNIDGVQYVDLEEVCTISRGRVISKDYINENKGIYPVYSSQTENNGELGKINTYAFDGEYLTWTTDGANAGSVFYRNGKFSITNVCGLIRVNHVQLNVRFLYHFLSKEAKKYVNSGMGNPKLMSNVVAKIEIPLPPLEVQREIVRILDQFAELAAELAAELTARKKQYAYYRGALLTFDSSTQFERLGDTCNMKAGKAIAARHISPVITNDAPYQCYGGNGVRGYVNMASHHGEFPIIGRQGALCGNVNYANGDFYATEHAVVVESKGKYIQKFLYYLLLSMNLNQYKSQGAQPGLAVGNLENIVAPVPTLEEQHRIVSILDRFDTLCNDLTSGLPAEVEARRKQYEYYRDKLLTFEESESNE